jgi:hypothetical protein
MQSRYRYKKGSMKAGLLSTIALVGCASMPGLGQPVYTVPGTANIFSAGLSTPVDPGGDGAGTLPILVPLSAGVSSLQFSASGAVYLGVGFGASGPDGYAAPYAPMNINSYGGVSGYYGPGFALTGVFLTDATPVAPAPSRIDFTGNNLMPNFTSLAPAIGQVFFIGDGLAAGSGIRQTFYVPGGATRLFLGMPDVPNATGDPGAYGDNGGSLSVVILPEPTSTGLVVIGWVALLVRRSLGVGPRYCAPRWRRI